MMQSGLRILCAALALAGFALPCFSDETGNLAASRVRRLRFMRAELEHDCEPLADASLQPACFGDLKLEAAACAGKSIVGVQTRCAATASFADCGVVVSTPQDDFRPANIREPGLSRAPPRAWQPSARLS